MVPLEPPHPASAGGTLLAFLAQLTLLILPLWAQAWQSPELYLSRALPLYLLFFFFIIHTTVERTNLMSAFPSGHKGRAHVRLSPRSEHVAGPPGSAIDLLYAQGALRWSTVYAPVHRALRTEKSETGKPNYFQRSQWFNGGWGETDHGQTGVKSLSGGWDMETLSGHAARTRRSLSCPCRVGPS